MNKTRKIYVIVTICIALIASILLASCNTTTQSSLNQADTPDLIPIEYGSADVIENAPKLATTAGYSSFTPFSAPSDQDDGVRYPNKYFNIPNANEYLLPVGGFQSGSGSGLIADFFGNLIPSSGDAAGRNSGSTDRSNTSSIDNPAYLTDTSRQLGWEQKDVFAAEFYTNVQLSAGLTAVAEVGQLNLTLSCLAATNYYNTKGGFDIFLGFTYTNNVVYTLLANETISAADGGSKGSAFSTASKGQYHSDDLFGDCTDDRNNGGEFQVKTVSFENRIVASDTIGNGGIRLHFLLGSDKRSGFYIGNVKLNVEVINPFEGAGTESNPYKIKNATDLQNMAAFVQYGNGYESAYYKQTADIDLGGISNFTPIGVSPASGDVPPDGIPFEGTYDGNGYKIKNLTINSSSYGRALFGYNEGIIKGVTLIDGSVTSSSYYNGSIVAFNGSGALIEDCVNYSCAVNSAGPAGGIAGVNYNGRIERSLNWGKISKYSSCSNINAAGQGKADGWQFGGIAGLVTNAGSVTECANYSDISIGGNVHIGGITGWLSSSSSSDGSSINYCINGGAISASGDRAGHIACYTNSPNITNSYSFGNLTSKWNNTNDGFTNFDTLAKTANSIDGNYIVTSPDTAITAYNGYAYYISDPVYNEGYPYLRNTRYTQFVTPVYNERGLVNGTVSDTHVPTGTAITSWDQFLNIFRNSSSAYTVSGEYYLANDITASNGWYPNVGSEGQVTFSGVLDGNGHTITLSPNTSGGWVRMTTGDRLNTGMIVDVLSGGTIKNLNVVFASNTNYWGDSNYNNTSPCSFGGVVGLMEGGALLYNCTITYEAGSCIRYHALTTTYDGMGGVVGRVTGTSSITDCTLIMDAYNSSAGHGLQRNMNYGGNASLGLFVGVASFSSTHTLFERCSIFGSGKASSSLSETTDTTSVRVGGFIGDNLGSTVNCKDLVWGFTGTFETGSYSVTTTKNIVSAGNSCNVDKLYYFDNRTSHNNKASVRNEGLSGTTTTTGATVTNTVEVYRTMVANNYNGVTFTNANACVDRVCFEPDNEDILVLKGRFSASIGDNDYVIGHVGYNGNTQLFATGGSADGIIFIGTKSDIDSGVDVLFKINKSLPTSNVFANVRIGKIATINVANTTYTYSSDIDLEDIVASIRDNTNNSVNTDLSLNSNLATCGVGYWAGSGSTNRANSFENASVRIRNANDNIVYESWNEDYSNARLQAGTYTAELVTTLYDFKLALMYCNAVNVDYNTFTTANPFYVTLNSERITFTVNQASLTVEPTNVQKTYGDVDPVFSAYNVTSGTLYDGDALSGAFQRASGEVVANYAFNLGTIANPNYNISLQATNFVINKKNVTVTADNKETTYGEAFAPLTITIPAGALVTGDNESHLAVTLSWEENVNYKEGGYPITGTSTSANYAVTITPATYTINKKAITISADNKFSIYGNAIETLTYTIPSDALVNGDTDTEAVLKVTLTTTATNTSNVADYYITGSATSANYDITVVNGIYKINQRPISVTINNAGHVYGQDDAQLTISSTELVNGDTIDVITAVLARKAGYTVNTYGITATSLTATNYVVTAENTGIYTISKKPITVTVDDKTSVYGNIIESLTFAYDPDDLATINGVKDDVSALAITLLTKASETANVGTYDITGTSDSTNYDISFTSKDGTKTTGAYTITKRDVTITIADKTSVYGESIVPLTFTANNLVNGNTIADLGTIELQTSDGLGVDTYGVDTYDITVKTYNGDGTNYNVTNTSTAKGTYTITKKPITVYADNKETTYGEAFAPLTITIPAGALVTGDNESHLAVTLSWEENVNYKEGGYPITGTSNSANYDVTIINGTYTIAKKAITIYAVDKSSKYGDDIASLTYTIPENALVNGDTDTEAVLKVTLTTTATNTSNVDDYDITGSATSANYDITVANGTYTVKPKAITVNLNSSESQYGLAIVPPTPTLADGHAMAYDEPISVLNIAYVNMPVNAGDYTLTTDNATYSNLNYVVEFNKGGYKITPAPITYTIDDKASNYGISLETLTGRVTAGEIYNQDDLEITLTTTATSTSPKGNYTITGTCANKNYEVVFVEGTYTIGESIIVISIVEKTQVYGNEAVELTCTYQGVFAEGDNSNSLNVQLSRESGDVVGDYLITATYDAGEYTVKVNTNYYHITPRPLTITAQNKSSVYGDDLLDFGYSTDGNEKTGDDFNVTYTSTVTKYSNVGSYDIEINAENSNYAITLVNGKYTLTARPLTITADSKTQVFGETEKELTYTTVGIVNNDTLSGSLVRDVGETVATYAISQGTLANANYDITYVGANYVITERPITITPNSVVITYGDAEQALNYQVSGGDGTTGNAIVSGYPLSGALECNQDGTAGSYEITAGTLTSANNLNYDISFTTGVKYVINRANTVITPVNTTVIDGTHYLELIYNANPQTATALLNHNETTAVANASYKDVKADGEYYDVILTAAQTTNYNEASILVKLKITPYYIGDVTPNAYSKLYGDLDPEFKQEVNGLNGETLNVIFLRDAVSNENAGTVIDFVDVITDSANYTASMTTDSGIGKFTINVRPYAVTPKKFVNTYGENEILLVEDIETGFHDDVVTVYYTRESGTIKGLYDLLTVYAFNSNYEFTIADGAGVDKYEILPKDITVTAKADSQIFGDEQNELGFDVVGLVGNESLNGYLTREEGTDVGEYNILQGTVTNELNPNYNITFVSAKYTVTAREIYIVPVGFTKNYGDEDGTITYSIKYGYSLATGIPNVELEVVLQRETGEDVNDYPISLVSSNNDNYSVKLDDAYCTILPKEVIVTPDSGVGHVYGSADADITYTNTALAFTESELEGKLARADGTNVGEYAISIGTLNELNPNYDVKLADGTFNYTISPYLIKVTAQDVSVAYGDPEATLTPIVDDTTPLIGQEQLEGSLEREAGSVPGEYDILIGTLHNDNYTIEFTPGTYTIVQRKIFITLKDQYSTIGEAIIVDQSAYTITAGSIVNNEDVGIVITKEEGTIAGFYTLDATCTNECYTLVVTTATYRIYGNPSKIRVDNTDVSFVYNGNAYVIEATCSSGAEIKYYLGSNEVENSFVSPGLYIVTLRADATDTYSEPDPVMVTITIYSLTIEHQSEDLSVMIESDNGFHPDSTIKLEKMQSNSTISGLLTALERVVIGYEIGINGDDVLSDDSVMQIKVPSAYADKESVKVVVKENGKYRVKDLAVVNGIITLENAGDFEGIGFIGEFKGGYIKIGLIIAIVLIIFFTFFPSFFSPRKRKKRPHHLKF